MSFFDSVLPYLQNSTVGFMVGLPFGYSLTRSRMTDEECIRDQFRFRDFRMMKMFLTATATGCAIFTTCKYFLELESFHSCSIKPLRPLTNILGGCILGGSMYYTGSCPGTVWAQLGSGVKKGVYLLGGGLAGTLSYALIDQYIPSSSTSGASQTLNQMTNSSFVTFSTAFAAFCLTFVFGLDKILGNSKKDNSSNNNNSSKKDDDNKQGYSSYSSIEAQAWSPLLGGAVIGAMQFPSIFFRNAPLGASSAYVALLSSMLATLGISPFNKYLAKYNSAGYFGQLVQDFGALAGGYFAMQALRQGQPAPAGEQKKLSTTQKIKVALGGFALLFGARMAGGCPSGHGLSGLMQLATSSALTVAGMFAGGFLTAQIIPQPDV